MGRTSVSRWQALLSASLGSGTEGVRLVLEELRRRYDTYPTVVEALDDAELWLRTSGPRPPKIRHSACPTGQAADLEYEEALQRILDAGRELERDPRMSLRLGEPQRRSLILTVLNARFGGPASGETFNQSGKPDILLRSGNHHVLIGECKIWRRPGSFTEAIDQILRYLTWEDTHAVLVLFIQTKGATAIMEKASNLIQTHARCVRAVESSGQATRRDFVFSAKRDRARKIHLTFLPFVITPPDSPQARRRQPRKRPLPADPN